MCVCVCVCVLCVCVLCVCFVECGLCVCVVCAVCVVCVEVCVELTDLPAAYRHCGTADVRSSVKVSCSRRVPLLAPT